MDHTKQNECVLRPTCSVEAQQLTRRREQLPAVFNICKQEAKKVSRPSLIAQLITKCRREKSNFLISLIQRRITTKTRLLFVVYDKRE